MTESSLFNSIDVDRGSQTRQSMCKPSNSDVLDLQGLCDRCMGNIELVRRVLDKFEQRLPEELVELERVLELGDAAKIALVAHRIKGNSSNVSAVGLQQAAEKIEDLSRVGRVADVAAHLRSLHEQWRLYLDCRATSRPSATDATAHGQV
jgi:HPt (histidine-containing phosphotransfer) domain-containing protein